MVPDLVGCADAAWTRDFYFILPTAATVDTAPCDLPKAGLVALSVVCAVVYVLLSVVVAVGAMFATAAAARTQLLLCLTHTLPLVALFIGTAASPSFWAGDASGIVFILWGMWGGCMFAHILAHTQQLKILSQKMIPDSVTQGAASWNPVEHANSLVETVAFGLSAAFIFLCALCWIVLVPLAQGNDGVDANLYYDSQGRPSKQFWWALGCWCHPVTALLFIFIPFRYLFSLLRYIKSTRSNVEHVEGSPQSAEIQAARIRRDKGVVAFEAKLRVGVLQAVIGCVPAQTLWIVVSDTRILGMKWFIPFILTTVGAGFVCSVIAYYVPFARIMARTRALTSNSRSRDVKAAVGHSASGPNSSTVIVRPELEA